VKTFWINVNGRPMRSPDGAVLGGVIVCRDVTERRMTEQTVRQAQKMEAVGRLAGGIAHDFNNLLTVITGYCELLLYESSVPLQQRDYAEQIQQAAQRAASLTGQLLTFGRGAVVRPKPISLNSVIHGVEGMLRGLIGEDVALSLSLDPAVGAVKADVGQFEQVIMNLAVNARDAMPGGGKLVLETADIQVTEAGLVPRGDYVLLAVTDTGCGMDAETQSRIFEPFFTTKARGKGTGLGLAIVYGIVQQGGGCITVDSRPGMGSTFNIYLPRVAAPVPVAPGQPAFAAAVGGAETVLLVEDEGSLRSLVHRALASRGGYRVIEASCGEEALKVCRNHHAPIDLVLTDVVMPGLKGPDLVARLRPLLPGARVLYMSGYADNALEYFQHQNPDAPLLSKPFTTEGLLHAVREVLRMAPPPALGAGDDDHPSV